MLSHPDIVVEKKFFSSDEDKIVLDSKLLIPTLKDFFSKHLLINLKTFPSDAAFNTVELYKSLLTGNTFSDNKHFSKAYIPLNARTGLSLKETSTTSRIIFVLQDVELRMQRYYVVYNIIAI